MKHLLKHPAILVAAGVFVVGAGAFWIHSNKRVDAPTTLVSDSINSETSPKNDAESKTPPEPTPQEVADMESLETVRTGTATIKGEVWVDNWFNLYANGELVVEDSVSIDTERSFNQETFEFSGTYPMTLAFTVKDFKQNDTGLEYIGTVRQQMGDGGFIAQFTDTTTGELVGVTDESVVCTVIHKAPLNKACENNSNPVAGSGTCTNEILPEPAGWMSADYDDSSWAHATVYSTSDVGPKDGYNEIKWNSQAELIWGDDLETDNTLLCRMILGGEKTASVPTEATTGDEQVSANAGSFSLQSSSITSAGALASAHTCDGSGLAPSISWSGAPEGTQSLAVIMDHNVGGDEYKWYWTVYNIPASETTLSATNGVGTLGTNSVHNDLAYAPPCSKGSGIKEYTLTVYALSNELSIAPANATRDTLLAAIERSVLGSASLPVTVSRGEDTTTDDQATLGANNSHIHEHFSHFDGVHTSEDDTYVYVASEGLPEHNMMVGITSWQQQVALPQGYTGSNSWSIPQNPTLADSPLMLSEHFHKGAVAIAVNGVPMFNAMNNRGEFAADVGELDEWGGHSGKADDYHYHLAPEHLEAVVGAGNPIAYALDGFALYAETSEPLDEYLGRFGSDGTYQYHAVPYQPYFIAGFRGEVQVDSLSNAPEDQVIPQARTTPVRTAEYGPLQGAVITGFEKTGDQSYSLEYTLGGETRYVRYSFDNAGTYTFDYVDGSGNVTTESFTKAISGVSATAPSTSNPTDAPAGNDAPPAPGTDDAPPTPPDASGDDAGRKYCGDGICDNTESDAQCAVDCN